MLPHILGHTIREINFWLLANWKVVMTVFLLIKNQTEFSLTQNRDENCHCDYIPFGLEVTRNLLLCVHEVELCFFDIKTNRGAIFRLHWQISFGNVPTCILYYPVSNYVLCQRTLCVLCRCMQQYSWSFKRTLLVLTIFRIFSILEKKYFWYFLIK